MKNKRNEAQKGDLSGGIPQKIVRLFKWIAGSLSRNLGLKLLSLLIAILMWNYVITTDKSITRAKTIYNLTGTIRGQTVLTDNKLALTEEDPPPIKPVLKDYREPFPGAQRRVEQVLEIMLLAYRAALLKEEAQAYIGRLGLP